jgi:hypothetical protein
MRVGGPDKSAPVGGQEWRCRGSSTPTCTVSTVAVVMVLTQQGGGAGQASSCGMYGAAGIRFCKTDAISRWDTARVACLVGAPGRREYSQGHAPTQCSSLSANRWAAWRHAPASLLLRMPNEPRRAAGCLQRHARGHCVMVCCFLSSHVYVCLCGAGSVITHGHVGLVTPAVMWLPGWRWSVGATRPANPSRRVQHHMALICQATLALVQQKPATPSGAPQGIAATSCVQLSGRHLHWQALTPL